MSKSADLYEEAKEQRLKEALVKAESKYFKQSKKGKRYDSKIRKDDNERDL